MIALLIVSLLAFDPNYDYGSFDWNENNAHDMASAEACKELQTPPEGGIIATDHKYCKCSDEYGTKNKITVASTTIGQYAFYKCEAISTVTLPDKISSIGVGAFAYCPNLVEVINFPDTLNTIGDGAFYYSNINTIPANFPKNLNSIGYVAFARCSKLTQVIGISPRTPPTGSTNILQLTIKNAAFYCTNVKLPASLPAFVSIGNSAFESCYQGSTVRTVTIFGSSIGEYAFSYCSNLNVVIGDGSQITSISAHAFEYTATSSTPNFPLTLRVINDYAYSNTPLAGNIDFKDVATIGGYAFYNTKIGTITLDSVTSIGEHAFESSTVSGKVTFSKYLSQIGDSAFKGTNIGGPVEIPKGTISEHAFENCKNLGSVTYGSEVISRYEYTISGNAFKNSVIDKLTIRKATIAKDSFANSEISSVEITDSTIQTDAFEDAKIATSLTIIDPSYRSLSSGDTIASRAFTNCEIQNEINLTDVRGIADEAFYGLSRKYSPTLTFHHDESFETKEEMYSIGSSAFRDTSIVLVNPSFDNTYKSIGEYAFANCIGVTGDLYLNVGDISDYAFYHCNLNGNLELGKDTGNLPVTDGFCHLFNGCDFKSFNISQYEHGIPGGLFSGMSKLSGDLVITDDITSIGNEAFLGCDLTSITISVNPNAKLSIGPRAFYNCKNMRCDNLTLLRDIDTIDEYAFYKCNGITGVTFSPLTTTIGAYSFAQTGIKSLVLPKYLTTLNKGAFQDCTSLAGSLDIPATLETFEDNAFYNCPFTGGKLTTDYHLSSIPNYAFYRCKFSGNLNLPRIASIGEYAFYECSNLQSVEFYEPYTTTTSNSFTIGEGAFQGCTGLTGSLPIVYCSSIGKNAFYGCGKLTGGLDFYDSKTDSLTQIPAYAFYNCSGLNGELKFPSTLNSIEPYAFSGCNQLKGSLIFPQPLSYIGNHAFEGCSELDGSIEFLPDGSDEPEISEIGSYAFRGCTKIKATFNTLTKLQKIGDHAFAGCTGLSGPIGFTSTLDRIGEYAFEGCSGLSNTLSFKVGGATADLLYIERGAFKDCTGFKDGVLTFDILETERNNLPYYRFRQFLKIGYDAFENTKFKNIYYNGRFEPDCDCGIGIPGRKPVHTSSHYANKTFCGNPLHKSKLSGGAIAGIVIAVVVVVAIIVAVVVYFILKNKKNKDRSEAEVEMNQDP